ncbi:MAG: hypothetical protein WAS49_14165 [Candidatus Dechloromonas phosphoritropha]|jgi:hypothetical protein
MIVDMSSTLLPFIGFLYSTSCSILAGCIEPRSDLYQFAGINRRKVLPLLDPLDLIRQVAVFHGGSEPARIVTASQMKQPCLFIESYSTRANS